MNFNYEKLEFNKILTEIASYSKSKTAQNKLLALKPHYSKETIIYQQELISEALTLYVKFGNLPLIPDYDIKRILNALKINQSLSLVDLQYLRLFLVMGEKISKEKSKHKKEKLALVHLGNLFNQIEPFTFLTAIIDTIIGKDGDILDKASSNLFKIRKDIIRINQKQKDILAEMLIKKQNSLTENVIVIRNDKYCLAVKSEAKNKIKGFIHGLSASKTTTYIEPESVYRLSSELALLHSEEKNEINLILSELSATLQPYQEQFLINLNIFVELDCYFSLAQFSYKYDCYPVNIGSEVNLIKARHPLINQEEVVPINLKLSQEKPILMITGPNTGGKTVALKTLGLLSIMAQCGLLIPADKSSTIKIFQGVYADIGDAQSIAQSLSTFSSHIINIINILELAASDSLLLFDELGSGTDPKEGVSLAKAIIDFAYQNQQNLVLTTHYSELKMFAYNSYFIESASVKFDLETLKPLYLIEYGKTGSSNALNIVKRLKMKAEIVASALNYLKGEESDFSKTITKLEEKQSELDLLKENLKKQEEELQILKEQYQAKLLNWEREKATLQNTAKKELESYFKKIQKEVDSIIEDLKNIEKTHQITELKSKLSRLAPTDNNEDDGREFQIGDQVFIKKYRQKGVIKALKNEDYLVQFGDLSLTFKNYQLSKIVPDQEKKKIIKKDSKPFKPISAAFQLDLRGYRALDVSDAYYSFIDQALLANLKELKIIHGFGTGTVKTIVHNLIKKDKNVKEMRMGGAGEGGLGATIITLK